MEQLSLEHAEFLRIAKCNYERLTAYCGCLEEKGYWEMPYQVIDQGIFEVLDLYLQSVLYEIAVHSKRYEKKERFFIAELLGNAVVEDAQIEKISKKINMSPPILLQITGLYDVEEGTDLTSPFFDCILNVILAFVYIRGNNLSQEYKEIQNFYERSIQFIESNKVKQNLNSRYIFRKLSSQDILPDEGKFKKEEVIIKQEPIAPTKNEVDQKESKLEQLMDELDAMIGLYEVKEQVHSLINMIKVRTMRKEYNMPIMEMTFHMVFTGNPGTGKTTVARLMAKIFKELGLLSKGTMVEVDRSKLVAGYVGQTAIKVAEVVNQALGGVLFIDEAYALATHNAGGNDFGTEAIDTLVKMMEDHRDDLIVIVAGYQDEMQEFLNTNTGLVSRFNKFINFKDYSADELQEILELTARKSGYEVSEEAKIETMNYFKIIKDEDQKQFGNARGVRNTFEKMVLNQANRVVTIDKPSEDDLRMLLIDDLPDEVIRI